MNGTRALIATACVLALNGGAFAAPSLDDAGQFDANRGTINLDQAQMPPQPKPAAQAAQIGNPLWAIPLGSLANTRNRPLFTPSRRPPAPPAVVVVPPPSTPNAASAAGPAHPQLTLIGTVVGETEGIGVFLDQSTNNYVRMKAGESRGGWRLRSVKAREVTLDKDGREETLRLPANKDAVTPPPPPAPPGEPL
jgi:general secretion pathway protein N